MTMAAKTPEQKDTQAQLREIFKRMDAHQAQEIREAYYKAMEGLMALSEALEIADARQPQTAGPLLGEHLHAVQALEAMHQSQLGVIL
jgi:hypothetical protein